MKNRVWAWVFQAPIILLVIVAFVASIYLKVSHQYNFSWGTPIVLLIILVLFFIGKNFETKENSSIYIPKHKFS